MTRIFFFLCIVLSLHAQSSLPRSTPEAEGVRSEQILKYLDAIAAQPKHEMHSIMIMRHGKVIAEGWWNPYKPDLVHTMYSCSKSFTATAVGFAVAEKKLSVQDQVISFFPDKLPVTISDHLKKLKVKDLLTMTVGQRPDPTGPVIVSADWVKTFFEIPIIDTPGTTFLYNSAATYMLSAIVQKVTGEKIIDYLKPRLFIPLGIQGIDWEVDPHGINTGGWGLRLKTEDMAKFAQLFLQKGKWKGKQILPAAWVAEASTAHIMQNPMARIGQKDSSDWLQGYGYQMWRSRYNGYRGDGAFGQYMLVFPDLDVTIAITSETPDMQGELNLIYDYLLPAFSAKKLKANPKKQLELKAKLSALALPIPKKQINAEKEQFLSQNKYSIVTTNKSLTGIELKFNDKKCDLTWYTDSVSHTIPFGKENWVQSNTTRKGTYLVAAAQANRVGIAPYKVIGSYTWIDNSTAEFTLRYIESPHTDVFKLTIDGDLITIDEVTLFNKNIPNRPTMKFAKQKIWAQAPRLIVRGDDMGFSHSANEALIKCFTQGIETSIEVIVPSPWFPEAVKMLKENPSVDVGLHFAITSEWDHIKWRPLTDCASIKDADGYFYQMIYKNAHYPNGAVTDHAWKLEDIEKELRAQIAMAKKYIPRLSHVSGHMNSLAFDPKVKEMAARVAQEMNIPMVDRDPVNDHKIEYIGFDFRNKTTEQRIDGFIQMLDRMENGKTYVYVEHPGIDNAELRAIHHIGYTDVAQGRQDVTTMWTSEKVKEAIARKGIELVSYKDIIQSKK